MKFKDEMRWKWTGGFIFLAGMFSFVGVIDQIIAGSFLLGAASWGFIETYIEEKSKEKK